MPSYYDFIVSTMQQLSYSKKEFASMQLDAERLPYLFSDIDLTIQMCCANQMMEANLPEQSFSSILEMSMPEMTSFCAEICSLEEVFFPFHLENSIMKGSNDTLFNDLNIAILIDSFFSALDDFINPYFDENDVKPPSQIKHLIKKKIELLNLDEDDEKKEKGNLTPKLSMWTINYINEDMTFEEMNFNNNKSIKNELEFVNTLINELNHQTSRLSKLEILFILYKMNATSHCLDVAYYLFFHKNKKLYPIAMCQLLQNLIPHFNHKTQNDSVPKNTNELVEAAISESICSIDSDMDAPTEMPVFSDISSISDEQSIVQSMINEDIALLEDTNKFYQSEDNSITAVINRIFITWKDIFLQSFIKRGLKRDEETVLFLLMDMGKIPCIENVIHRNPLKPVIQPIYHFIQDISTLFASNQSKEFAYYTLISTQKHCENESMYGVLHKEHVDRTGLYEKNPYKDFHLLDITDVTDEDRLGCIAHIFQMPVDTFQRDIVNVIGIYILKDFQASTECDEDIDSQKLKEDIEFRITELAKRGRIVFDVLAKNPLLLRKLSDIIPKMSTKSQNDMGENDCLNFVMRQSIIKWEIIHQLFCEISFDLSNSKDSTIAKCFSITCKKNQAWRCRKRFIDTFSNRCDN